MDIHPMHSSGLQGTWRRAALILVVVLTQAAVVYGARHQEGTELLYMGASTEQRVSEWIISKILVRF